MRNVLYGLLVFGLLLHANTGAYAQTTTSFEGVDVAPGRIVVWYDGAEGAGKAGALEDRLARIKSAFAVQDVQALSQRKRLETWEVQGDMEAALAQLNALPGVRALPDFVVRLPEVERRALGDGDVPADSTEPELPTNDPFLPLQWALNNDGTFEGLFDTTPAVADADIDAFEAWEAASPFAVTPDGDTIAVVIFDTGVDLDHLDLQENLWVNRGEIPGNGLDDDRNGFVDDVYGYDAAEQDGYPDDEIGHGTHVAGTVGAVGDNGIGISGVAQRVKIIPVKIFDFDDFTFFSTVIRGLDYITALLDGGVPVVASNHSWGYDFTFVRELAHWRFILEQFALEHQTRGHVWVTAAGNATTLRDESPFFGLPGLIQAPNVINVAATNAGDEIAVFSDFGRRTVEVAAPGQDILSTVPPELYGDPYAYFSGTSMAAPHVAGAIALAKARYPDEDPAALIARMMATSEEGAGATDFEELVMGEGRLNLHYALIPSATGEAGLLPGPDVALFSQTALDEAARLSAGFANATGGPVEVQDVAITGPDAEAFSIFDPDVIIPDSERGDGGDVEAGRVPTGGAYGVPLTFVSDGQKEFFEAELVISTSAGPVTIPLDARDKPFATIALEPNFDFRGFVPLGDTIRSTFTLSNSGTGPLEYEIQQTLIAFDEEATAGLQAATGRTSVVEAKEVPASPPSLRELGRTTHALVSAAHEGKERPTVELHRAAPESRTYLAGSLFSLSDVDLEVFWSDSLNNPEAVAEDWEVIDISELAFGVPSTELWELEDVSAISGEEGDLAFVAGDLDGTYQPNAWTGVWSPQFDFRGLAEEEEAPYYLRFDLGSNVEGYPFDILYVNIVVDGFYYNTVALTGPFEDFGDGPQPLPQVANAYEALIDITDLVGRNNVEFLFVFTSDSVVETGFGVYFDNPAILKGPAPYFASSYDGTVPAGGSEEITVVVRTGLLGEGEYLLITDVFSDASFFETSSAHFLFFETSLVGATVEPPVAFAGPVVRGEQVSSTFTIENVGAVPAEFEVIPSLISLAPPPFPEEPFPGEEAGEEGATSKAEALAERRRRGAPQAAPGKAPAERTDLRSRLQRMMRTLPTPTVPAGKGATDGAPTYASRVFADEPEVLYFEDFEGSDTFPEGWTVEDNRFGLSTEWEIVNIGTEEDPNNVAFFGDLETLTYENLSETYAISPFVDLSGLDDAETAFLEFDYAAFLEPFYDVFAVFAGVADEDGFETLTPLGSSEDRLFGSGTAVFDIGFLRGESQVFFVFAATSDVAVDGGYAFFDNVAVYAEEAMIYATPRSGELAVGESEEVTLVVDTDGLRPGPYVAVADVILTGQDALASYATSHLLFFDVINQMPMAVDDTLGVVAGGVYPLSALLDAALGNDVDADGDTLAILDVTEPLYGDLRRTGFDGGAQYVAPRNYDGYDYFEYLVTDGYDVDTARVVLAVMARPEFVTGVQQQFTFIEGDSLTLNTMRLAAGVGGLDEDVVVWAETDEEDLNIAWDFDANTLTFWADEGWFGQAPATLYVADRNNLGAPYDALDVTVVVAPLDNIRITIVVVVEGASVAFAAEEREASEAAITAWRWDFGDGAISTKPSPTHTYRALGTYDVTLTTTDAADEVAVTSTQVTIASLEGTGTFGEVPETVVLEQNYPNPFNPATTIRFGLPEGQRVTLRVYNTLGRVVATLYDDASLSAGYHTTPFDASGLASGVYLYQLETSGPGGKGRAFSNKKMILVK